jgi:hypothetical protein
MNIKSVLLVLMCFIASTAFAEDSFYCPENEAYIKVGMTESQIIQACGPPLSKHDSGIQVTKRVPVTQLMYSSINSGFNYGGTNNLYDQWSLPKGPAGVSLQVNIMNKKVTGINYNGANTNAMSICSGGSFQVGDNESNVYNACGTPTTVNNSFIDQPIPSNQKPEVWVYQNDKFQSPFSLTIINGKLQSINLQ